jgi:hypothetical protein
VRQKASKSSNEASSIHGILKEKGKKREKGGSISRGRPKYPRNSKAKCCNYDNVRHFRRDYKEEKNKNKKDYNDLDDESKTSSHGDGGDVFVAYLATHVGREHG